MALMMACLDVDICIFALLVLGVLFSFPSAGFIADLLVPLATDAADKGVRGL